MSERKDIDQIFREEFNDYKAKSDKNLEEKMAAMIGVGAGLLGAAAEIAGSGTVSSAGTATEVASGLAGAKGTVASATVGVKTAVIGTTSQAGILSQSTGILAPIVKTSIVKIGLIAKSFGIIQTAATITVVGTATSVITMNITETSDSKTQTTIETGNTARPSSRSSLLQKTLQLNPQFWIDSLEADSLSVYSWAELTDEIPSDSTLVTQEFLKAITPEKPKTILTKEPKIKSTTVKKNSAGNKSKSIDANATPLAEIDSVEPKDKELVLPNSNDLTPLLSKDSITLTPSPMKTRPWLYFPNHQITTGFHIMPLVAWQTTAENFENDSVEYHEIGYQQLVSWQAGAELRVQKKTSPWFFQLGLNYLNLKQKKEFLFQQNYIDYAQNYWQVDTLQFDIYVNPPNIDTILEVDSTYIEHWIRRTNERSVVSNFQYLDIPFQLGYEYHKPERSWSIEASAGLGVGILLSAQGITYSTSGEIMDFSTAHIEPKLHFYALGQVGVNYYYRNMSFFIRPNVKYYINQTAYNQGPEKNRWMIIGSQFGIRIKILTGTGNPAK